MLQVTSRLILSVTVNKSCLTELQSPSCPRESKKLSQRPSSLRKLLRIRKPLHKTCSGPSKTSVRDKPPNLKDTLSEQWGETWTGTQPSASTVTQQSVSFNPILTWLLQPRKTAQTRCVSPRTKTVHSVAQQFALTSHSKRRDQWRITQTMVTSPKRSIFFSQTRSPSLVSRSQTSRHRVIEQALSNSSKPSATATRSESSTQCTTRPRKFAVRPTIVWACVLSWRRFRCCTISSEQATNYFGWRDPPAHKGRDKQKTK